MQTPALEEHSLGPCGKLPATPSRIPCQHAKKKKVNARSLPGAGKRLPAGAGGMPGQLRCQRGCPGSALRGQRRCAPPAWRSGGTVLSLPGRGHLSSFIFLSFYAVRPNIILPFSAAAALSRARRVQGGVLLRGMAVAGRCSVPSSAGARAAPSGLFSGVTFALKAGRCQFASLQKHGREQTRGSLYT